MTRNMVFHRRTKHIELCYHFISDQIEVKICSAKDQIAYGCIKSYYIKDKKGAFTFC